MAEANTKADGDASSIPLWKTNGNENKLHHVLVQEEAVRNGLDFLRGLQQQLRLQLAQTPSAGPRLEKIGEAILQFCCTSFNFTFRFN